MFLDASALVAIVAEEPGFEKLLGKLGASKSPRFVSALVKFETVLAVARIQTKDGRKPDSVAMRQAEVAVDALLLDLDAKEMAVTPDIAREALHAARTYGKIIGHPAALNFGDCFAYACAKALNVPLLYKGNDFSRTDLA